MLILNSKNSNTVNSNRNKKTKTRLKKPGYVIQITWNKLYDIAKIKSSVWYDTLWSKELHKDLRHTLCNNSEFLILKQWKKAPTETVQNAKTSILSNFSLLVLWMLCLIQPLYFPYILSFLPAICCGFVVKWQFSKTAIASWLQFSKMKIWQRSF